MLPLCILYGITGILISYIISLKAPSQLAAFLWTIGYMVVAFLALALAYTASTLNPFPILRLLTIDRFRKQPMTASTSSVP